MDLSCTQVFFIQQHASKILFQLKIYKLNWAQYFLSKFFFTISVPESFRKVSSCLGIFKRTIIFLEEESIL